MRLRRALAVTVVVAASVVLASVLLRGSVRLGVVGAPVVAWVVLGLRRDPAADPAVATRLWASDGSAALKVRMPPVLPVPPATRRAARPSWRPAVAPLLFAAVLAATGLVVLRGSVTSSCTGLLAFAETCGSDVAPGPAALGAGVVLLAAATAGRAMLARP